MNDESLIEAREKTKEVLFHLLTLWVFLIPFMIGAFALSWFTTHVVIDKVCGLIAVINIFYFGVISGCFLMYNIFWGKMETTGQKEKAKSEESKMTTLKRMLDRKSIYLRIEGNNCSTQMWRSLADIIDTVREWLQQNRKQTEKSEHHTYGRLFALDELLEELNP